MVYLRRQKCVGRGNCSRVPKERKHAWKAFASGNVEEKGFIDKEPETWWGVQTYVTDRQGRCSGKYNPTTKDGKLNFEWLLEATEENRQKIIDEIYRRANAIWYREDWYLEDLEEAIRSTGLEVTQERVDKLLEECHRIFDDKSGRNEMLAQKASKLFEEE